MRRFLAVAALLVALGARAETAAVAPVAHDPLARLILSRQIASADGGVTGAVRLGSGQAIALSGPDALAPLAPVTGLVPLVSAAEAKEAAPAKRKASRKAVEQLKRVAGDQKRTRIE